MIMIYLIEFILLSIIYSRVQSSKEVILLDTRDARDYLNWFKISTNGHFNNGWGELSFEAKFFPTLLFPSLTSTLWRTQYVCDITSDRHIDHWLRSPYLKRQDAKRIEIELGFSIRDCSAFQTPEEIRSCRETFELYIYETDEEEKEFQWSSYQLVDVIAGNRFTSNHYGSLATSQTNNLTVNVKTRGISIEKNGFYIAFRDQGACVSILYVKIFYRLCEEINRGLVYFSSTPTGAYLTDIIEREGICTTNSKMIRKPLGFCKGNGQWTFQDTLLRDSCYCQEGYELLIDNHYHHHRHHHPSPSSSSLSLSQSLTQQQYNSTSISSRAICRVCPIGTFKSTISNEHRCEQCPANSYTEQKGSTYCRCQTGFFRLNATLIHSACIAYPREPENITIDELDQASVKISWGLSIDTVYHIECYHSIPCEPYLTYEPSQRSIQNRSVRISGLDSNTNYQIKIIAEQISTRILSNSVDLSFSTEQGLVKPIEDIQIRRISFNKVQISWSFDNFDRFHFRYWSLMNPMKKSLVQLKTNNFTLLSTDEYYRFQIRGHTQQGWTVYTREQLISLPSLLIDEYQSKKLHQQRLIDTKRILFFGPFTLLGSVMTVIILVLIYTKKRRSCRLKTGSDCESLDYQKRQVNGHYGPDAFFNSTWTSPLWPPIPSSTKTYVDPHTYEDPNKAVIDFTREMDPTLIVIESVIGGGEFGDVCRGTLRQTSSSSSSTERTVAIKTLKPGATEKIRMDFLSEASIMGQFHHENVIYLEGVVTKHHPIMIVTEYMENGSLDTYLRTNEGNQSLDALQLISMLRGIASGMKYLSDMKYIHRDLAARNILVNKDLICKVSDFGLSREISEDDSYTTKGGKIPIRWTAIEAIDYRKFTSASDVWSFGILCWEVISFGERPYWNWSNQDVIRAIKNAYRLPPPMNCPEVLYQLMLNCWNDQYLQRPKFQDLVQQLTDLIQHPIRLIPLAKHRSIFVNDPDQPNIAQITTVADWLETLHLDHLISYFTDAGYINLSQICHMNSSILSTVTQNKINRDEQIRLVESLKHIRSQLILSSSKLLLLDDGLMV